MRPTTPTVDPAAPEIRLWIVEDNENYLQGLCRGFERLLQFRVTGYSGSVEEALSALAAAPVAPEVILLDVGLPGMDGIAGVGELRRVAPQARILLLTVFEEEEKIFRAVCAGVSGYLLKSAPVPEIADAVREVHEGGAPMHPRVASRVLQMLRSAGTDPRDQDVEALLDREKQVLHLMAEGLAKKQIAFELGISIHTVTFHLRRIYEKLHVNTNTGAIAKAIRYKFI